MRSCSSEFMVNNLSSCSIVKPRFCGSMKFTVLIAKHLIATTWTKSSFSFLHCVSLSSFSLFFSFSFFKQLERKMPQSVHLNMCCTVSLLAIELAESPVYKHFGPGEFTKLADNSICLKLASHRPRTASFKVVKSSQSI